LKIVMKKVSDLDIRKNGKEKLNAVCIDKNFK
jgi:hypothetical protein